MTVAGGLARCVGPRGQFFGGFGLVALVAALGLWALFAHGRQDSQLADAGFYAVRDLRYAFTDAVALDRTLELAILSPRSPELLSTLARAADLYYIRFDVVLSAPGPGGTPPLDGLQERWSAVQSRLEALVHDGQPVIPERLVELRIANQEVIRLVGDYMRNLEDATDAYILGREDVISWFSAAVAGSILVLCVMACAVLLLLDRDRKAGRAIRETLVRDALTGLLNRRGLAQRFAAAEQQGGPTHALIVFDVDDFKPVNDKHGHATGDTLLIRVARWLEHAFGDGIVARWGGDEFVVCLPTCGDRAFSAGQIGDRMASLPALTLPDSEAVVTFSCGAAFWPEDGVTIADAMQKADLALYEAKEKGKGRFVTFEPDILERRRRGDQIRSDLKDALRAGDLFLHWQPQVSLTTARARSAEALVRWRCAETGRLIPPGDFIPVAETSDLILELDRYVLDKACGAVASWATSRPGPTRVSINISPRHFSRRALVEHVKDALRRHDVPPDWLEIEITEGVLLGDDEVVRENLAALSRLGVRLALDDFGTGYSNIGYLMRLKPDVIKIDRSFVADSDGETRFKILSGMVSLARSIGAEVLAEGVETAAELQLLKLAGCETVQGYHIARPMPEGDLLAWWDARDREAGARVDPATVTPAKAGQDRSARRRATVQ